MATGRAKSRSIMAVRPPAEAPKTLRTPISRVRSWAAWAAIPKSPTAATAMARKRKAVRARPHHQLFGVEFGGDLLEGMALDGAVGGDGGPLVVDHSEGFFEMPGLDPNDDDAGPSIELFQHQWLHLASRTVEVEVLDDAHDALVSPGGHGLAQWVLQSQHPDGGLVDDHRFGIGRRVGKGASLEHAQAHDLDEVGIHLVRPDLPSFRELRGSRTLAGHRHGQTHRGDAAVLQQLRLEGAGLIHTEAAVPHHHHLFRLRPEDGVLAEQSVHVCELVPHEKRHRQQRRGGGELGHHQTPAQASTAQAASAQVGRRLHARHDPGRVRPRHHSDARCQQRGPGIRGDRPVQGGEVEGRSRDGGYELEHDRREDSSQDRSPHCSSAPTRSGVGG